MKKPKKIVEQEQAPPPDPLDIPPFLRVTPEVAEQRRQAWLKNPPTAAMAFKPEPKVIDEATRRFMEEEELRKKNKTHKRVAKMKVGLGLLPSHKTHDYNARTGSWVRRTLYDPGSRMRPDFETMGPDELVKAYNQMAVEAAGLGIKGVEAVKKFKLTAAGVRRCSELWVKIMAKKEGREVEGVDPIQKEEGSPAVAATPAAKPNGADAPSQGESEMATRKSSAGRSSGAAKKARGKTAKKTAAKKSAKPAGERLIAGKFKATDKLVVLQKENPRFKDTGAWKRYNDYSKCKTVGDFVEKYGHGQASRDIAWDVERKHIKVG